MPATLNAQSCFSSVPSNATNDAFARLPSSSTRSPHLGLLEASILSVYDLPLPEQPQAVTLSTCGITVSSGPPVARHKDRNSFRFSTTPTSSESASSLGSKHELKIAAPLRDLYMSNLKICVLYSNQSLWLESVYVLRQLRVNENTWLILTLREPGAVMLKEVDDDHGDESRPTIRLKLQLRGPYRPEVATFLGLCKAWFDAVDRLEDNLRLLLQSIPKLQMGNFFLISVLPFATGIVVASPVVIGLLTLGIPFFLPLLVLAGFVAAFLLVTAVIFYASTRKGRADLGGLLGPYIEALLSSRAGQTLVYDTGPRPTPVSVTRQIMPKELCGKLVVSLTIDLIGSMTYLIPVVGEGLDLAWAPIQTILLIAMYESVTPSLKYVSFLEEILPFTDIVPTATIGWAVEFGPRLISSKLNQSQSKNGILAKDSGIHHEKNGTPATTLLECK